MLTIKYCTIPAWFIRFLRREKLTFVLTMKSIQVFALLSCLLPIFAAPSSGEQKRAFPSSTKKGLSYNTAQYTVILHSLIINHIILTALYFYPWVECIQPGVGLQLG